MPPRNKVEYAPTINAATVACYSEMGNVRSVRRYSEGEFIESAKEKWLETAFKIKKVIFNDPATIIMWEDNTKTVVKANNEPFDKEKGFATAIAKKALGNKRNFNNVFKKYI